MRLGVLLRSTFAFHHIVGWNKEKDHFDIMETSEYATFREEMNAYLDTTKEVKIYHFELKKVYGDW
jgi:hypothetical protein